MSVFKVLTTDEWLSFEESAEWHGSAIDQRDGFIHLSTNKQAPIVISRYYGNHEKLVIVEFDPQQLGNVKWEPPASPDKSKQAEELREFDKNQELFPHFYGQLKTSWIVRKIVVERADGWDVADLQKMLGL